MFGLKYNADLRTLFFMVLYAVYVATRFTWSTWEPLWLRPFLLVLTSLMAFQGAVSVHNAVHCPPFQNKQVNQVFHVLLSLWFGHSASAYVPGHNLSHHKYLQSRKDFMRTTNMRYQWHLLNLLMFVPSLLTVTPQVESNYFNAQKRLNRPIYRQMRIEMTAFWILQIVLALTNTWRWIEVMLLPQLLGKYMIITLNILQHDGCDPLDKYNNSRNFTDPILNFFYFNNGYHTIHHLYPGKHWSLIKDAHEAKIKPHMHPNLDQSSLFSYLYRTFINPGIRLNFEGKPLLLPEWDEPEAWFYEDAETFSQDREFQVSADIFGPRLVKEE